MTFDAEQIRIAARAVDGLAGRVRAAGVAVTGAGHARWESVGAQRFRQQLSTQQHAFGRCARELDDLSRSLLNHATHVEAHERTAIKIALAIEKKALEAADDVVGIAGNAKDMATGLTSSAGRTGKNLADIANPFNALRAMR